MNLAYTNSDNISYPDPDVWQLRFRNRLFIRDERYIYSIEPGSILFLQASGNYTQIVLEDGRKFTLSKTLKYYEQILGDQFFRPHHSYLVNFYRVTQVMLKNGICLVVEGDFKIPVANSRKRSVLNLFKN